LNITPSSSLRTLTISTSIIIMTRFSTVVLLIAIAAVGQQQQQQVADALSMEPQNRRAVMGWLTTGGATAAASFIAMPQLARAESDGMDVSDYLKTGQVAMPMGVSGQAGKSKPETGVYLRDGSDVSRDSRTGDVLAEIVVNGNNGEKAAVLASYSSPWSLGK